MDPSRFEKLLYKQTGKAVRPSRVENAYRSDGFVNIVNRFNTAQDDTAQYFYTPEPIVDDTLLEMFYENNGLFAKIIDTPAEEAVKHGFELEDISDDRIVDFYKSALDELDWEETAMLGVKWARLFGGALGVLLVNDGRGLEEPLDWKNIKSIDDIRVFDRSMIQVDYTSMFKYDPVDPFRTRGSRLGTPEWYYIESEYGNFTVHDSRCLDFRNGILSERALNWDYRLWGVPEYVRIKRAVQNAEVAHDSAPKMLSKSIQPVYKMKDLAIELATEQGEDRVLRRLQTIDMARGMLNSITIDAEGEDYSFQQFGFTGVQEVIDASCNWLSALTSIPQTILFGRSPAGMNATGQADFENYYNFVERIQKRMLRSNLRYLLAIIFTAGIHTGEIPEMPDIKVKFNPLWSVSDSEQAALDLQKAQLEQTKAGTAIQYIQAQVLDPTEVRKKLWESDDFDVETMLDDYTEEELDENAPSGDEGMGGMGGGMDPNMMAQMMGGGGQAAGGAGEAAEAEEETEAAEVPPSEQEPQEDSGVPLEDVSEDSDNYAEYGNSPESAPEATKIPQDMEINARFGDTIVKQQTLPEDDDEKHVDEEGDEVRGEVRDEVPEDTSFLDDDIERRIRSVGVIVEKDGKFLTGFRHSEYLGDGLLGGPGGHVEGLETAREAAIRETQEEFGITPTEMVFLGLGEYEEDTGLIPAVFLCTKYEGIIENSDMEMIDIRFRTIEEISECELFEPFEDSLFLLADTLKNEELSQKLLTNLENRGIIYQEDGEFKEEDHPRDNAGKFAPTYISSSELKEKIKSGRLSTAIKPRQSKHFYGTDLYKSEAEKAKSEGRALPSYLTIKENELKAIINATRGKGNAMKVGNSFREFVEAGKVVGYFIDQNGKKKPTTKLMVHYSKDGCHAVPGNPMFSSKPVVNDPPKEQPQKEQNEKTVKNDSGELDYVSTEIETQYPPLSAVEPIEKDLKIRNELEEKGNG